MVFKIELTWSKIIALVVLMYAFVMDLREPGHSALIYTLPFITFLITGKQVIDSKKK